MQLAPDLPGDPQQQDAAREKQADDRQQLRRDQSEDHARDQRQHGADEDHPALLGRGQARGRGADHHGIVAGEHDVDQHDAEQRRQLGSNSGPNMDPLDHHGDFSAT